jgi:hypothetical protein
VYIRGEDSLALSVWMEGWGFGCDYPDGMESLYGRSDSWSEGLPCGTVLIGDSSPLVRKMMEPSDKATLMTEGISPQGIDSRSSLEILVAVDMTSLPQLATRLAVNTVVDPRTQIDATTRSM